jgi:hypothetical protein
LNVFFPFPPDLTANIFVGGACARLFSSTKISSACRGFSPMLLRSVQLPAVEMLLLSSIFCRHQFIPPFIGLLLLLLLLLRRLLRSLFYQLLRLLRLRLQRRHRRHSRSLLDSPALELFHQPTCCLTEQFTTLMAAPPLVLTVSSLMRVLWMRNSAEAGPHFIGVSGCVYCARGCFAGGKLCGNDMAVGI